MTKTILSLALGTVLTAGCSGIPKNAFLLTPSSQADRQQESRIFHTRDESILLKDCAAILQNMGYKMDLHNADLGLLSATKESSSGGFASTMLSIFSAGLASPDKDQVYKATFTVTPTNDRGDAFLTRLTLQRMIVNSHGKTTEVELIKEKDFYNLFYQRLEAATFIEPDFL